MFNLLDKCQNVQYFGQRIHQIIDEESEDEVHWVEETDQITDRIKFPARKRPIMKTSKKYVKVVALEK